MLDPGSYKVEVYANPGSDDIYNTESAPGVATFAVLPKGGEGGDTEFVVKDITELMAAIEAGKSEITLAPGSYDLGGSLTVTAPLTLKGQEGAEILGGFKLSGEVGNFRLEDLVVNANGADILINLDNTGVNAETLLSFFGRVNYDYKRRYSAGVTLRADGSSKFAKGNRWGFFPSAAVSWTISNEPFMSETRWIDQLKLRYSFGTAGNNNIPSGLLVKQYSSTTTAWLSQSANYWMAGKVMNNPDLTWETTYTHNIGLDFGFFRGALSGSIEAYQNDTKDLLINFPITGSGYDSQYRNIGSTRNRGVELTLNAPIIEKKNFSLNISGNIAYNVNRVTDLGGLESITAQSYWASTEIGDDYSAPA